MRHTPLAAALSSMSQSLGRRASLPVSGSRVAERPDVWMQIATAAGLMLLAAALRVASIDGRSLWFDEAFAALAANQPLPHVIAFTKTFDTHPPLYYLVLSIWIGLFGTGEFALRSLGAVASTLTVGVTWWLGRRLGGPFVGLVGAFLTAVAPLHVMAAQEARMYPLLSLLVIASWAALLAAVNGRGWAWPVYVAAAVLALYTHYFAVLVLAGQAIFVLAAVPQIRQRWLASQLVIPTCYLPWLSVLMDTVVSGKGWPFFRPPLGLHTLTTLLGQLSFGGHILGFDTYFGSRTLGIDTHLGRVSVSGAVQTAVLVPFLALVLGGALHLRRLPQSLSLLFGYFLVPLALAFVFSLHRNIFDPRYFSFLVPPFAILTAAGMAAASARAAPAFRRAVALGLVLVHLGFVAPALNRAYASGEWNWRAAAAVIKVGGGPNDLILLIPAVASIPFGYYHKGPQRVEHMTPRELWDVTGGIARPDPAADAANKQTFRAYAARHRVMWIVATRPFPIPAWERLKRLLADVYEIEGLADFRGVSVLKAVRRSP